MRGIQKRKSSEGIAYQAQVRIKGYKGLSKTFKRKTDAIRWKQQTEADIRRQLIFPECESEKRTLSELIDRYLADRLPELKSKYSTKQTLNWWKDKLGHLTLNRISSALIKSEWDKLSKIKSERTEELLANRTLNAYLQSLSAAYTAGIKDYGWVQNNPVSKIRKKALPQGRTRFLTQDERKDFLRQVNKSPNDYLKPAVLISLATGGRKTEVLSLKWKDVELKKGYVTFRKTKNGETRTVPVRGVALKVLKEHALKFRYNSEYIFPTRKLKWKLGEANSNKPWEDLRNPFVKAVEKADQLVEKMNDNFLTIN